MTPRLPTGFNPIPDPAKDVLGAWTIKVDGTGEMYEGDTQEYLDSVRARLTAEKKTFSSVNSAARRKLEKDGFIIYQI